MMDIIILIIQVRFKKIIINNKDYYEPSWSILLMGDIDGYKIN